MTNNENLIARAEAFDWGQDPEPYAMAYELIQALQSVTVPTENEREEMQRAVSKAVYGDERQTIGTDRLVDNLWAAGFRIPVSVEPNPFAESGYVAAKHWAELVKARNRIAALEAAAVPVEPSTGVTS
jgi:hypothetical protein